MLVPNALRAVVVGVISGCVGFCCVSVSPNAFASVGGLQRPSVKVPSCVVSLYQNKNSFVVRSPALLTREDVFRTALSGLNGLEGGSLGSLFEGARAAQVVPQK